MDNELDETEVEPETTPDPSSETEPAGTEPDGSEPEINTEEEPEKEEKEEPEEEPEKEEPPKELMVPKYRFDEVSHRAKQAEELLAKVLDKKAEPEIKEEPIDPDSLKLIERAAKQLGFVRQEEVQRNTYEQEKEKQVNLFLEKHPEYSPKNDPNSEKWGALMQDFFMGYGQLPSNPKTINALLERSHSQIATTPMSTSSEDRARAKMQKEKIASLGSGGGGSKPAPQAQTLRKDQIQAYKDAGFSEQEINDLFK